MDVGLGVLALRDVAHDGEHLAAGIGQVTALEVALRLARAVRELEGGRRTAQRGIEALHGARQRARRQQLIEVRGAGRRGQGRQPRQWREAVADQPAASTRNMPSGMARSSAEFFCSEAQRLDGAGAAQHVADAVHQQGPVDGLDHESVAPAS